MPPTTRQLRTHAAVAIVVGALVASVQGPASAAVRAPSAPTAYRHGATTTSVTLVTGDVVRVLTQPDGHRTVSLLPGRDGTVPNAAVNQVGTHLYVVPESAIPLLSAGRLSSDLFDVSTLIADRYDDASRSTLPLIVDYGRGRAGAQHATAAAVTGARRTHVLPLLGDASFTADKKHAHDVWRSLTRSTGGAAPTQLTGGAVRVMLDGRVHVTADPDPLEQIHAREAWAAGFDGKGVKVAVLDTGYDPTHPDLAGVVAGSANFTPEADVTDGNGHGTHVAGTIAGTGAASGGRYVGAAPGAKLLIGKVLGSDGTGEDSQVLAGMEWAVAQHADVVSMSLGGDTGDGTDPLEQAVDDLSASSPTLFVIAAGNNGEQPGTVTSPGAASAALTVGAVDSTDTMAFFSSRGPRLDGTVKPEVVAPGVDIVAARAAGTSLGTPVDDYYTTLSGTSMATPHVAAVAAILKQEHPTWDGERLKAAIVGSTVPIAGASAYDAGTGRVDAVRALDASVVADPTLNLGYFAWPHTDLAPKSTPLTYTNLDASDVTLALALTSQDGTGDGPPGVRLSTDHVSVPAGGTASVDVVVDPTVAAPGAYSGLVVATPAGGGQSVRTAVAYGLEDERYDVTVEVTPRAGTQSASHVVALTGLDDFSYQQRTVDAAPGVQRVTFRVPPGRYSANVTSFGTAADDSQTGVLDLVPVFDVTRTTTVPMDENKTRLVDYRTDKPVVNDGEIVNVQWSGKAGTSGAALAGSVDRLYLRPMTRPAGGTVFSVLNMQLSQPEALLTLAGGGTVPARPVTDVGVSTWVTPVPTLPASMRIVDSGTVDALHTAGVRGAAALVAGTCSDMTAAATMLATAGAAAMITYPGHGSTCAGTIAGTPPLPAFRVRPLDANQLRAAARAGGPMVATTNAQPSYVYDLAARWADRVPGRTTLDGTASDVAALVETYRSMGGTTASDGLGLYENMTGIWPDLGYGIYGLTRVVPVPGTVTHYVSPGPDWERDLTVTTPQGGALAVAFAPPAPVVAGRTTKDIWLDGPVLGGSSRLVASTYGWGAQPNRQGDTFFAYDQPLVDSAGHQVDWLYDGEYFGRLSTADGTVVGEGPDPLYLNFLPADPKRQRYSLDVQWTRTNAFWQRSTSVHTVWGFASGTTAADHQVLPLMQVALPMSLDDLNRAPAGAYAFGLVLSMPAGVTAVPVSGPRVELSWDGGAHWQSTKVTGCGTSKADSPAGVGTRCTVQVVNRAAGGSASLRVTATDTSGRSVQQTVLDAYAVG